MAPPFSHQQLDVLNRAYQRYLRRRARSDNPDRDYPLLPCRESDNPARWHVDLSILISNDQDDTPAQRSRSEADVARSEHQSVDGPGPGNVGKHALLEQTAATKDEPQPSDSESDLYSSSVRGYDTQAAGDQQVVDTDVGRVGTAADQPGDAAGEGSEDSGPNGHRASSTTTSLGKRRRSSSINNNAANDDNDADASSPPSTKRHRPSPSNTNNPAPTSTSYSAKLSHDLSSLRDQRDALRTRCDALHAQRDDLRTRRNELTAQHTALTAHHAALLTQRAALLTQRRTLTTRLTSLTKITTHLRLQRTLAHFETARTQHVLLQTIRERDGLRRQLASLRRASRRRDVGMALTGVLGAVGGYAAWCWVNAPEMAYVWRRVEEIYGGL